MRQLLAKLTPFIMLGIALVAIFYGLLLLAYVFVFGAIVGMLLFSVAWLKAKLFPSRQVTVTRKRRREGRIINHDDL